MLNPNEISNKKFEKTMGRYRPDEVDAFLRQTADAMNEMAAQNRELENKMLVLAEKLEEYRQDEDSMRSALIGAQKLGDSVVREAKAKATAIVTEANDRAGKIVDNAQLAIEREKNAFMRMQREVATFKSKLQLLYKQHLELISSIPVDQDFLTASTPAPVPEPAPAPIYEEPQYIPEEPEPLEPERYDEELPELGGELEYTEQKLEYTTESYEPESEPEPQPQTQQRRESRFGPLKFGKEFDIRRDEDKRKK